MSDNILLFLLSMAGGVLFVLIYLAVGEAQERVAGARRETRQALAQLARVRRQAEIDAGAFEDKIVGLHAESSDLRLRLKWRDEAEGRRACS